MGDGVTLFSVNVSGAGQISAMSISTSLLLLGSGTLEPARQWPLKHTPGYHVTGLPWVWRTRVTLVPPVLGSCCLTPRPQPAVTSVAYPRGLRHVHRRQRTQPGRLVSVHPIHVIFHDGLGSAVSYRPYLPNG